MAIERFETERLSLRELTLDDVGLLVELNSDPAVMRLINGGHPTPPEEVEASIRLTLGSRWAAYDRDAGFVGWFSVRPWPDRPAQRELGYRLRQAAWGNGFATEGSQALIALAFTELGTDVIRAQTMTVNTASRRVMEKCGLRFVRTFFGEWDETIEGGEHGDVEYELLKPEWERGNA